MHGAKARVARASRIFVEGRHDAELVEKVWGDDLRIEGVVVEYLGGVDDLADHLRDFKPGPQRRVGVLVDHLVPGSKEARIAQGIARSPVGKHVLVVGHPFIDIWQAVKPERLGIARLAGRAEGIDWKTGTCQQLGWPHRDQADIARAWKHILGRVTSYADLEPALLGRVEELIDFTTAPEAASAQSTRSRTIASASSRPRRVRTSRSAHEVDEPVGDEAGDLGAAGGVERGDRAGPRRSRISSRIRSTFWSR